jgi:hypothetical protein
MTKKYPRIASNVFIIAILSLLIASCSKTVTTEPQGIATHTLFGFVTDSSNHGQLPFVSIKFSSTVKDTSLLTDSVGGFKLSGIASGTYTVTALKTGYAASTVSITLSSKTTIDTLRIRMGFGASDIPTAGLAADISFGDSVTDAFGNPLIFHGAKFPMEGRFDRDTSALLFENDDYATLTMPLPFSHNFTACVWFNDFGIDVVKDMALILENSYQDYGLQMNIQQGKVFANLSTDSVEASVSGPIVRNGRWHFIAAVMTQITDRQTQLQIFVDGKFYTNANTDTPIADGDMTKFDNTFYIGGEWDASNNMLLWPLRGMLDGIRLYNRTLSVAELMKLFHEKGW